MFTYRTPRIGNIHRVQSRVYLTVSFHGVGRTRFPPNRWDQRVLFLSDTCLSGNILSLDDASGLTLIRTAAPHLTIVLSKLGKQKSESSNNHNVRFRFWLVNCNRMWKRNLGKKFPFKITSPSSKLL